MVKKVIFHDRHPYSYKNLSYDKKENKYYHDSRFGGPGSPNPGPKPVTKDEAASLVIHETPNHKREVKDIKRYEALKEHQKPEWGG